MIIIWLLFNLYSMQICPKAWATEFVQDWHPPFVRSTATTLHTSAMGFWAQISPFTNHRTLQVLTWYYTLTIVMKEQQCAVV